MRSRALGPRSVRHFGENPHAHTGQSGGVQARARARDQRRRGATGRVRRGNRSRYRGGSGCRYRTAAARRAGGREQAAAVGGVVGRDPRPRLRAASAHHDAGDSEQHSRPGGEPASGRRQGHAVLDPRLRRRSRHRLRAVRRRRARQHAHARPRAGIRRHQLSDSGDRRPPAALQGPLLRRPRRLRHRRRAAHPDARRVQGELRARRGRLVRYPALRPGRLPGSSIASARSTPPRVGKPTART